VIKINFYVFHTRGKRKKRFFEFSALGESVKKRFFKNLSCREEFSDIVGSFFVTTSSPVWQCRQFKRWVMDTQIPQGWYISLIFAGLFDRNDGISERSNEKMVFIKEMKQFYYYIMHLILLSTNARGQTTDTVRVYDLGEVVIVGYTTKEIIPVQQLRGKTLQNLSVHSVADAIRYFSGAQIKDYGGIGGLKTVNIRSMGSQHVGVFYDGIEMGNAQNGIVDLGRFSLDNMEAISLYNGQKSAIFQPAKDFASAGSVYMQTRIPVFRPAKRNNLKASFKSGSFDLVNPSMLWERKLTDRLSAQLSAEYMQTSGKYKFSYTKIGGYDTTEVRKNGDVYALRVESGLFGTVDGGEWKAKLYFYNSERGFPGASVREKPGEYSHQDRQWDSNIFVQSSFKKRINERYSILLSGKYAYDYLHYRSDPREDVTTMYIENRYRQQELYFSSANRFDIAPILDADISVDFQWNSLNADLLDFVYPHRYTVLAAAAAALDLRPLKLQAGILATMIRETARPQIRAADDKNEYTPTVIASCRPWTAVDLNFRGFYKRIFRMPTLNDLYYTFIGNANLAPEYTTQYDVGLTFSRTFRSSLKYLEFQADAYFNQVENKIIAVPTSNQFRWTMINLGYVEIRGIDMSLISKSTLNKTFALHTRINYTFQKAQDFTVHSVYFGGQIPYIQSHSGSAIIGVEYRSWNLNYSFIYTGERYHRVANIPENYIKPWYTSDFSLSKELVFNPLRLRLTAEVNNLFNQQYEVVLRYPMPGTNFRMTLNVSFNEVGQSRPKSTEIDRNRLKSIEIDQNRPKSTKIDRG
jgi:outer membrane cobalamin receptor